MESRTGGMCVELRKYICIGSMSLDTFQSLRSIPEEKDGLIKSTPCGWTEEKGT